MAYYYKIKMKQFMIYSVIINGPKLLVGKFFLYLH